MLGTMEDEGNLDSLFRYLGWGVTIVALLGVSGFLILLLGVHGTEQITREKFRQGLAFVLVIVVVLAAILYLYLSQ